jgi:hypothetical protein
LERRILVAVAGLGIVGCGRSEQWTEADRQSLAALAERVAAGVGAADVEAFDQAGGITSADAYAVITINPRSAVGAVTGHGHSVRPEPDSTGSAGLLRDGVHRLGPGETSCHGAYGDGLLGPDSIRWSASRQAVVAVAPSRPTSRSVEPTVTADQSSAAASNPQ